MNSPGMDIDHEEVIADSEDEGAGLVLQRNDNGVHIPRTITQDTILTGFDTNITKQTPMSSINDSVISTPVADSDTRPQPRLLKKTILPRDDDALPNPNPTFSSISNDTGFSNIAERAKMRSRSSKVAIQESIASASIIELSSDGDDYRLPPPTKKKRTTTKKLKASAIAKPIAESSSISAKVNTINSEARPRPRLLGKSKKSALSDPVTPFSRATAEDPSVLMMSSKSDNPDPIPFKLVPSQLPPSDPPTSTPSLFDHPPIETLPQSSTGPDQPSSPSSLFSAYSNGAKKRDGAAPYVDELEPDEDMRIVDADTQLAPPPTFFAGSSPPVTGDRAPIGSSSYPGESSFPKAPLRKKLRQKQNIQNDDTNGTRNLGESASRQPKSKRKLVNKIEVVIENSRSKPRKRGKGKKKQALANEVTINEDEHDDMDLFQKIAPRTDAEHKIADLFNSPSSLSESDHDDTRRAGLRRKRKPSYQNTVDALQHDRLDLRRCITPGNKSRRVVGSDDEGLSPQALEPSPSKNRNTKDNEKIANKRGLNTGGEADTIVVDSDITGSNTGQGGMSPAKTSFKENAQPAFVVPDDDKEINTSGLTSRYTIAPKAKPTPMSDLIRRVNSKPGSPFCSPAPRSLTPGTAYSPYMKASRKALARIAPLHPNRRTPPPPLPPPPPRKKTKKELEREEQWEEELIESVGGITEWACMTDAERKGLRKAKMEKETHLWED